MLWAAVHGAASLIVDGAVRIERPACERMTEELGSLPVDGDRGFFIEIEVQVVIHGRWEGLRMPNGLPVEKQRSGLEAIWRKYRAQAATARRLKEEQGQWRRVLLIATTIALVATPLAKTLDKLDLTTAAKVWVGIATVLFALTAWLNKEVLGDDSQQPWVRARQTAEGIKAVAFRFLMGASPFESPQDVAPALKRADELAEKVQAADTVTDDEAKKNLPPVPLAADQYIADRLDDQVRFYENSTAHERRLDDRLRKINGALSALIALFGTAGAVIAQQWRDIWAPALALASTTVTTQMARARHRYLIESYTRAAESLRSIKAIWESSGRTPADIDKLVAGVEDTLANENAGWVQQMLLKPVVPDQAPPSNKAASG